MEKANKAYGTKMINAYNALRHSWASQRLNDGFPLEEISAVLGHTSLEMTRKVYAQYRVERLLDVIKGKVVRTLLCNSGNIEDLERLEFKWKSELGMVGGTGIEPATSGL